MNIDRYHRQQLLPPIGSAGQQRLAAAHVLLIGCGALGSVIADQLTRAGVGHLRLADRDIVELTNLQRQVLFDESDAAGGLPKAVAAARRLKAVNSTVHIEPFVVDVHPGNIEHLAGLENGRKDQQPVHLTIDGTDNVETRYLINDLAVKHSIPWIYGAAVGTEGRMMAVLPGRTACLRCLFPNPPSAGELPTCDTAGVLGPAAGAIACLQAAAAIRCLVGDPDPWPVLFSLDIWNARGRSISGQSSKDPACPCCGQRRFEFLDRPRTGGTASLCGRNAVQVSRSSPAGFDLKSVAARLMNIANVEQTPYLLRCSIPDEPDMRLTVFSDGRSIIYGTSDPAKARSIVARYVGA